MITPKELLTKSDKLFSKIVRCSLHNEQIFPLTIPSNKQLTGSNFSDWKNDLVPLYEQSKKVKTKGYSVEWKEKLINGSKQSVPTKIYFESLEDYLSFTGRIKDYKKVTESRMLILRSFATLEIWTNDNVPTLLDNFDIWPDILKVCRYFVENHPPHPFFIRELPIEVHSKFIEQNEKVIKKLLDMLLPSAWVNTKEKDFSDRYYLKKVNIYTQIRILDEDLKPYLGYDECALTLEDAGWLKWLPENVFIIENQACFLSFPKIKNSVAIFGEGFKSRISRHIPWLSQTKLYCWFDLDGAGFEMLNMIRQHYPNASNFLMDKNTFLEHRNFAVKNVSKRKELPFLQQDEQQMYDLLLTNRERLEQERISLSFVKSHIP